MTTSRELRDEWTSATRARKLEELISGLDHGRGQPDRRARGAIYDAHLLDPGSAAPVLQSALGTAGSTVGESDTAFRHLYRCHPQPVDPA